MTRSLTAADIAFINRVAARRFAGADPVPPDEAALQAACGAATEGTATERAAHLVAGLLADGAFRTAPLQSALLTLHCALALNGLTLLAPQGVLAGMLRAAAGPGGADVLARWVDDRAVPSGSTG